MMCFRCHPLGSHNSFSYSISPNSGVSPDSPLVVQNIGKWCKPLGNKFIFKWSQGQQQDVTRQLYLGIRYFDIRLVVYKNNDIVVAHGLYGGRIQGFLEEINQFLTSHPKEFVVLDFQHFYEFKTEDHERMITLLVNIFDDKICRRDRRMRENTLDLFRQFGNQILIVYRHIITKLNDIFWPSGTWHTPWHDKIDVDELLECLNKGLTERKDGMGHVSQAILTPSVKYITLHTFGSLKKLAYKSNEKIVSWLETKTCGMGGVNVVICDFIEGYDFTENVIKINYKNLYFTLY